MVTQSRAVAQCALAMGVERVLEVPILTLNPTRTPAPNPNPKPNPTHNLNPDP